MCPLLTSSWIRYSAGIGFLVRLSVMEAAQKLIPPPQTKKHGHKLKNTDDSHGVHKVRVFWKCLVTSIANPNGRIANVTRLCCGNFDMNGVPNIKAGVSRIG